LGVRDEEGVFPDAAFVGFGGGVLERADAGAVIVEVVAVERILEAPGLVKVFGREESGEACISARVVVEALLIGFEQGFPVAAAFNVLLVVCLTTIKLLRHLRDSKVVRILERSGDGLTIPKQFE